MSTSPAVDSLAPTTDETSVAALPTTTQLPVDSTTSAPIGTTTSPAEDTPSTTSDTPVESDTPSPTSTTPVEETTSSEAPPTTSTAEPLDTTTSTSSSTTSSEDSTTTTEEPTTTTSEAASSTTVETVLSTEINSTETSVVTITTTRDVTSDVQTSTASTAEPTPIDPAGSSSGGLDSGAKIAIGVAVPIGAIAIIAIVVLFWWKKRRARRQAEEERRKEVEDYSYNPNADPTIPSVGMGGPDGGYEMREDSSGYRGWGTTVAGSTGRKASTTMSGGGMAYSDATSPTQGHASLARSEDVYSPEGEILGAMGPAAANNRGTGVNRGPSNASSSYSAANRSDNSDGGMSYGNPQGFYEQQAPNPYAEGYNAPQELPAQPVIRDNPARRNTRIENPSHYPQQSAGISQNF